MKRPGLVQTVNPWGVMVLTILGGFPISIAAQQTCFATPPPSPDYKRFEDRHSKNWISNVQSALESMGSDDVCYIEVSHALEGLQRAYDTCGLWWGPAGRMQDIGVARIPPDTPPGTAGIFVDVRLQNPKATITGQNGSGNQHLVVFHEAHGHAALKYSYYLRKAIEAGQNDIHKFIRERSEACFENVAGPGISNGSPRERR